MSPYTPTQMPKRESAMTLIELVVVSVILMMVAAIGVMSFGSTKQNARNALSITTAQSYAEAIDRFVQDHSGRVPVLGSSDWPDAIRGPVQPGADIFMGNTDGDPDTAPNPQGKPYVAGPTPDAVASGDIVIVSDAAAATPKAVALVYEVAPPEAPMTVSTAWRLVIKNPKGDKHETLCWMGTWESDDGELCK